MALLVQGLYPHIGTWNNRQARYQIVANEKVFVDIHPSSINHPSQRSRSEVEDITSKSKGNARLLSFDKLTLLSDKNLVMQRTASVTPFMVSLFGGTLSQSPDNADEVQVDAWLPFDVRSTDTIRNVDGAAGQILIRFNTALRQLEMAAFRDLANREYVVDNELSGGFANILKQLLITEQDIDKIAEEDELDFTMSIRKPWNRFKSRINEVSRARPKDIVRRPFLIEETHSDQDSYAPFMELIESVLERSHRH